MEAIKLEFSANVAVALLSVWLFAGWVPNLAFGQTTGRIAGTVRDTSSAAISGATVTAISQATAETWKATTDAAGGYVLQLLPPGSYNVTFEAKDFRTAVFPGLLVAVTQTTTLGVELGVGEIAQAVTVSADAPLLQRAGPESGRAVGSRMIGALPLATRNFTQILTLFPGTATYLPDSTAVGRNTQAISVNGARVTQNNMQINGIDANTMGTNGAILVAVPAPETIEDVVVQTSLYDATFGRAGGGNIQIITKSGTNAVHGDVYEYFRNDALNANNPFLRTAGVARPMLRRNVFGGTFGGPLQKDKTFFFTSYQGAREINGASVINSLSQNVLVAQGLTDDRRASTLEATFHVPAVDPAALALLNARRADGSFVIPTPSPNGRYSGSSRSTFREHQFNVNVDSRWRSNNSASVKLFVSNTSQFLALPSFRGTGPNVPGFGTDQTFDNRLIAVRDIHTFSPMLSNELRVGYASNPNTTVPHEPITDAQIGVARANAASFPGLPLIRIAQAAGGLVLGTPTNLSSAVPSTLTIADMLASSHRRHDIRSGFEVRYDRVNINLVQNSFTRGQIDIPDFVSFLRGTTQVTTIGSGLIDRRLRASDYNMYLQDDWRVSPRLTVNLGVRYELDLPATETQGQLFTFDPSLYAPPQALSGAAAGPPAGGFVQAGNANASVPGTSRGSKYVANTIDANNLAPRLGFAYAPFHSDNIVIRGGYGVYYSRSTFQYASIGATTPPNYVIGIQNGAPLNDPFVRLPPPDRFPLFVPGVALAGTSFDRNLHTPYFHQYGVSVQHQLSRDTVIEAAYVGTRGRNLFRQVAINQASLARADGPIYGVTTNTPANAAGRAPLQGVSINGFSQNQSTARSTYHSLQTSLVKRPANGWYVQASYTYSKSFDNASGTGGGPGVSGVVNTGAVGDTSVILGNQLDARANWGFSDFDRPHRLVLSSTWGVPTLARKRRIAAWVEGWQISGILTAMSGEPIDIVDTGAGSFYGLADGASPLARPNVIDGQNCDTATRNIPTGYAFNPFAFARPVVQQGQMIPSGSGTAIAGARGTDIGNTPRNCLRGSWQRDLDVALARKFSIGARNQIEVLAEFFNLFNQVNLASPISNLNAVNGSGGRLDPDTGRVIDPGNFGRIISTTNNPRLIQLAVKFSY